MDPTLIRNDLVPAFKIRPPESTAFEATWVVALKIIGTLSETKRVPP